MGAADLDEPLRPMEAEDPCLQHGPLVPVESLLGFIDRSFATVVGREICPLRQARGRVLADDVISNQPVPAFDNSSVDGWAIAGSDLRAEERVRLPIGGRIAAGHPLSDGIRPGHAYQIFTGAPIPEGLDTVIMQEDARRDGDQVLLPWAAPGDNIRLAGEAIAAGQRAMRAGTRLRPQELGLAASLGLAQLPVRRALKVAVFSNGDEIRSPGQPLSKGTIYDSNRCMIMALLDDLGCQVTDLGILPDRSEVISRVLEEASSGHDLLISSGGVSVGEEDHVRRIIAKLGEIHLWRLALKPGRPLALGSIKGIPILALPGNPVGVMVTFLLIARPLIARLSGAAFHPPRRLPVLAGFSLERQSGRREFARVWLKDTPSGPMAVLFPKDSSGILGSMTETDGLIDLPEGPLNISPGSPVDYLPFAGMLS